VERYNSSRDWRRFLDIALSTCRFTSLLLVYDYICNNLFIHSIFAPAILRKDAITCRACRPTAKKTTRSGGGCTEGLVSRKPATYDIQSRFALLHKTTRLACSRLFRHLLYREVLISGIGLKYAGFEHPFLGRRHCQSIPRISFLVRRLQT
jgi:hypothetical protein